MKSLMGKSRKRRSRREERLWLQAHRLRSFRRPPRRGANNARPAPLHARNEAAAYAASRVEPRLTASLSFHVKDEGVFYFQGGEHDRGTFSSLQTFAGPCAGKGSDRDLRQGKCAVRHRPADRGRSLLRFRASAPGHRG